MVHSHRLFVWFLSMMDNDNDIDLVAIGWQSNKISWFENLLESPMLLNNPESIVFDESTSCYFISNYGNGNIIRLDENGNQSYFNTELNCVCGLYLLGDTLLAASNDGPNEGLVGFNKNSGEMLFRVEIQDYGLLNDITTDGLGNVYLSDFDVHKIYRIDINTLNYNVFVGEGLGKPNGLFFEEEKNRLIVTNVGLPGNPLMAVDIADSSLYKIRDCYKTGMDGIVRDIDGNYYISDWGSNSVYRFDPDFAEDPELISSGHSSPADLCYNPVDKLLCVPNFYGNSISYIYVSPVSVPTIPDEGNLLPSINIFPNPARSGAEIEIAVTEASMVSLKMFDQAGRVMETLLDRPLNKGVFNYQWFPKSSTPPGIYYLHLRINENTSTKKFIYTK